MDLIDNTLKNKLFYNLLYLKDLFFLVLILYFIPVFLIRMALLLHFFDNQVKFTSLSFLFLLSLWGDFISAVYLTFLADIVFLIKNSFSAIKFNSIKKAESFNLKIKYLLTFIYTYIVSAYSVLEWRFYYKKGKILTENLQNDYSPLFSKIKKAGTSGNIWLILFCLVIFSAVLILLFKNRIIILQKDRFFSIRLHIFYLIISLITFALLTKMISHYNSSGCSINTLLNPNCKITPLLNHSRIKKEFKEKSEFEKNLNKNFNAKIN